jgi:hypothetical protein
MMGSPGAAEAAGTLPMMGSAVMSEVVMVATTADMKREGMVASLLPEIDSGSSGRWCD